MRVFLPQTEELYLSWRRWQMIWRWSNVLLGGLSVGLGALAAAQIKAVILPTGWAIAVGIAAPITTFLLTALKPQANAAAFETASREIEKAMMQYKADVTRDDPFLGDAAARGIDLLNRIGSC